MTALHPADVTCKTETQIHEGVGETHPDVPAELLTISNAEPTTTCLFVTVLEVFPAGEEAAASASVDGDAIRVTTVEKEFLLTLPARGAPEPVTVQINPQQSGGTDASRP